MAISANAGSADGDSLAAAVLSALVALRTLEEAVDDDVRAEIDDNHEHALIVPLVDVERGEDKTYDIQGGARHDHSVTITRAMFARLARGERVIVKSSETNIHQHTVTIIPCSL